MIAGITFNTLGRNPRAIAAVGAVIVAVETFTWFGAGGVTHELAQRAATVAMAIQQEDRKLEGVLKRLGRDTESATQSSTSFLKALDKAVATHKLQVLRLVPQGKENARVQAELVGSFGDFIRFVADIEALGGAFRELQITRARESVAGADTFIFSLDRAGAPRLMGPFIESLKARVAIPIRDIFMPGGAAQDTAEGRYVLNAVTEIGGRYLATISDLDYAVGDALGSGMVTEIGDDHVTIDTAGSASELRFAPMVK